MGFLNKLFKLGSDSENNSNNKASKLEKFDADIALYAPVSGTLVPLEEVPDIVICEKVMGEGVAIAPSSETLVAPCDGVVTRLLATKNAFAIRNSDGLEVYVTLGVESLELAGEGFTLKASVGDEVKKGDPIISADLRFISSKLKSTLVSMIVISSSANIDKVSAASGACQASITPCVWIALK